MPFLSHSNFDTVHTAIRDVLDSDKPINEVTQLLKDALALMDEAERCVASPGLRELAHEVYGTDEVEIDDEGAGTSPSDEGVWVQAWVWLAQDQLIAAGLAEDPDDESKCRTEGCDEDANDGEGFDGYCGSCADKRNVSCDNCDWSGDIDELNPVKGLAERIDPGSVVPAGECPECGCLAYIDKDEDEPCPVNRRPQSTCPDGCTHGA